MAWSAVLTSPYNSETPSVFAVSSAGLAVRLEDTYSFAWGIDAPSTVATIAAGSLTGLTGDYLAKYTYGRKERSAVVCESNPSPAPSAAVTLANGSLLMTAAAPSDPQINCIRFYRTAADGVTYYYTGELNYVQRSYAVTQDWEEDGGYITGLPHRFTVEDATHSTEDCYTWELLYDSYTFDDNGRIITSAADNVLYLDDNQTDSELGTLLHSDHQPLPENGTFVFGPTTNGTVFLLKQHRCHYSKPQQPEYWPSSYYVDVSSVQYPLVCGVFYDTRPYLFDKRQIYYLAGTQFADLPDLTTFLPYPQEARTGALSAAAVCSVLGLGIFHVGLDGIYRFIPGDPTGTDEWISEPVAPIFHGETLGGIPAVGDLSYSWLAWFDDKLYFGFPSGSDTYPKNVLTFDFTRKKIIYNLYPFDMAAVTNDKYYGRLLVCPSAGNLNKIEDSAQTDDIGTAIDWEVETKEFVLQTRLHYPRWNKYDVDAASATTAYAYSYLEGSLIQTHTLTGDRDTRRRLIALANGNRYSMRLAGTGPVEIYAIESE